MKKYVGDIESGEQIKVCGRFYTVVQTSRDMLDIRFILFPMSGKILSPVILYMRQDLKVPVYPPLPNVKVDNEQGHQDHSDDHRNVERHRLHLPSGSEKR